MSTSSGMTLRSHCSLRLTDAPVCFDPLPALTGSWRLQQLILRLLSEGTHLFQCRLVSRTWNHIVTDVGRVFLNRLHWSAGGGVVRTIRAESDSRVLDCKLVNGLVFVLAAINCGRAAIESPRHIKVEVYAMSNVKTGSSELANPTLLWQCSDVSPWAKGLFSDGRTVTVWAALDTLTASDWSRTHRFLRFDAADVSLESAVSADIADDDFSVALMEAHAARTGDTTARDEVRRLTAEYHLRQAWSDNRGNLLVAYGTGRRETNCHLLTAYDRDMRKVASRTLKTKKDSCMVRDYVHPLVLLVYTSAVPCIAVWNLDLAGNPASVWTPHHLFPHSLREAVSCRLQSTSMLYLVSDGDNVGEAGSWNTFTTAQFARLPALDAVNVVGGTRLPTAADTTEPMDTSRTPWLMQTDEAPVALSFTARPHVKKWGGLRRARVSGPPLIQRLYDVTDWQMAYLCQDKEDTVLISDFSSVQY